MVVTKFHLTFLWFLILVAAIPAAAQELIYGSEGTQDITVTINHGEIRGFSFTMNGSQHLGAYPTNVTVDIGADEEIEWYYAPYHSTSPLAADSVLWAWSENPDATAITFSNLTSSTSFISLAHIGKIEGNTFSPLGTASSGAFGITSSNSISDQIIGITTPSQTIHAFLPELGSPIGNIGLYLAEGGSTYYCHTNHFDGTLPILTCNLGPAEAMVPEHLARAADEFGLNHTRLVAGSPLTDKINSLLSSCSLPCDIPLRISSASAGRIMIEDITIIGPEKPAQITLIEQADRYDITIHPNQTLTGSGYLFGTIPSVYIVPFRAYDDPSSLSPEQAGLLTYLNTTLASEWDNMTGNLHPMDFYAYLDPVEMLNLSKDDNYTRFIEERLSFLIPSLAMQQPAILVTIDIHQYYQSQESHAIVVTGAEDHISRIFINTLEDPFDHKDEIIRNTIIHEIAHTFMGYPPPGDDKLFYANHPGSFTDLAEFTTYTSAESPTGSEGYYDLFSIMNQVRIYMGREDIGAAVFTHLDSILLGIRSPYSDGNYTYYSAALSKAGNRYVHSGITEIHTQDTLSLARQSSDPSYWDLKDNATRFDMEATTSFSVPKEGQDRRSLVIYAEDAGHPGQFQVFAQNAFSTMTNLSGLYDVFPPSVTIISPAHSSSLPEGIIDFSYTVTDHGAIMNCTLHLDSTPHATNTSISKGALQHFYSDLVPGLYSWRILCTDDSGNTGYSGTNSLAVTAIDPSPPPPSGSGGSGGSGGGSGGSSPKQAVDTDAESKVWAQVPMGQSITWDLNRTILKAIEAVQKGEMSDVRVVLQDLNSTPQQIPTPPGNLIALFNLSYSDSLTSFRIRLQIPSLSEQDEIKVSFWDLGWKDIGTDSILSGTSGIMVTAYPEEEGIYAVRIITTDPGLDPGEETVFIPPVSAQKDDELRAVFNESAYKEETPKESSFWYYAIFFGIAASAAALLKLKMKK